MLNRKLKEAIEELVENNKTRDECIQREFNRLIKGINKNADKLNELIGLLKRLDLK